MSEHDKVSELIPWYVNGSLNEHEMVAVADHIERCTVCAEQVDAWVAISPSVQPSEEDESHLLTLVSNMDTSYDRLVERLPTKRNPQWLLPVAASVLAAVAVGSFFLGRMTHDASRERLTFEAMSSQPATQSQGHAVIQIIFQPQATEAELRTLLFDNGAQLLSLPSDKGVYRFALPEGATPKDYVDRLRTHAAIRWIGTER